MVQSPSALTSMTGHHDRDNAEYEVLKRGMHAGMHDS